MFPSTQDLAHQLSILDQGNPTRSCDYPREKVKFTNENKQVPDEHKAFDPLDTLLNVTSK